MLLQDLISVASFPAVVSASDIAALRQNPESDATADFLCGYLGFDAPSQHALATTLSSLSQTRQGGAFWISGVFGSGKSHLLGVLTLLGAGAGDEKGRRNHENFAVLIPIAPRFWDLRRDYRFIFPLMSSTPRNLVWKRFSGAN